MIWRVRWWYRRLRLRVMTLSYLLQVVGWTCEYCHLYQATSLLLWDDLKYQLICRRCRKMQNYPDYIRAGDPHPPRYFGAPE